MVVLANYGPDEGQGGFRTSEGGVQNVTATWEDPGLDAMYRVKSVWEKDLESIGGALSAMLEAGESRLYMLKLV
jgi:alpha-galactosidase